MHDLKHDRAGQSAARGAHMSQRRLARSAAPCRTALVAASVRLRARRDSAALPRLRQAVCVRAKSASTTPRPAAGAAAVLLLAQAGRCGHTAYFDRKENVAEIITTQSRRPPSPDVRAVLPLAVRSLRLRHAPRPQAARRGSRARRASRRYGFTVRYTHSQHARRSAEIARSDADAKPLSALARSEAASS